MAEDDLTGLQRELESPSQAAGRLTTPDGTKEELLKENWTWKKWDRLLPPWRRWLRTVRGVPKEIKWTWQRARRGYSDRDTWSFDTYLTNVIIGGLTSIRTRSLAFPVGMTSEDWDATLDEMITGFEKIRDREDTLDDVTAEMWQALELFADNYFDLWD